MAVKQRERTSFATMVNVTLPLLHACVTTHRHQLSIVQANLEGTKFASRVSFYEEPKLAL